MNAIQPTYPKSLKLRHTQGPWYVETVRVEESWAVQIHGDRNGVSAVVVADLPIHATALPVGPDATWDKQLANARLIAAAPELLAALRAMLNLYARTGDHVHKGYAPNSDCIACQARAVLTKAEGGAS